MAEFATTAELLTLLYAEVGDSNPTTVTADRLLGRLNEAHKVLVGGGGEANVDDRGNVLTRPFIFPWALSQNPSVQNTVAPIDTGTVAVTKNNSSATLSASQATDVADWFFRVDGDDEVYRIAAHGGASDALTLDANYVGDTDATASYTLFKLDYTFSESNTILTPTDSLLVYEARGRSLTVPIVDISELRLRYPLGDVSQGTPEMAGILKQGDGTVVLRLSHYTEDLERMELPYVPVPSTLVSGSVDPILPKHRRTALVHLATFYELRKRDDDRALSHLESAQRIFTAMKADARQVNYAGDTSFGRVPPFPGGFKKLQRRGRWGFRTRS